MPIAEFLKKSIKILFNYPVYFLTISRRKLKNLLPLDYYFYKKGFAFYPTIIHMEVTHHCNMNCSMCTLYSRDRKTGSLRSRLEEHPMDIDLVRSFLREVSSFRPLISLTGGEPLLYKEIDTIFSLTRQLGLDCCITTNGTLLEEHAGTIVDNGLISLLVSIDAPQETHDAIRGVPQTYEKAMRGIQKVIELKRSRGAKRPRVIIATCISNRNYRTLSQLLDKVRDLDIESVNIEHLWFWTLDSVSAHQKINALKDIKVFPQSIAASQDIDTEVLIREIEKIKRSAYPFPVNFFPDLEPKAIKDYYDHPARPIVKRCISPWRVVLVLPWGEVLPCLDYSFGSLETETFANIWNSRKARDFRILLKKHRIFPSCRRCCGLFIV